ncbi:MAG: HesA/MoeB/ThiF family protein [Gammaproteobacteria bacterium]|nr:HesA/MoeB/ThiF family protein [Gammaproteobacteria bacterium]MCY4218506.1 HesA/MoeB/ThiF family protein [Gammaproteobacteria bacterium]MCY4276047.1 HesA/MoeB/ThiF family protein [Gammaproteobacteria bacterium]
MTPSSFQERYSRQIRLPQIGIEGQERLRDSSVLIVGMGGLGSPVGLYLAAAGVGTINIADFDHIDESNLQRQVIHEYANIGQHKAESAANRLRAINPDIQIETLNYALDYEDFMEQAQDVSLIVDCSDNFPTRFELNDVSRQTQTPLVSGAAIRWEGQVTSFDPRNPESPCYQCLYPDRSIESATCEMEGVIAPLVGIIGSMQAMEAINALLGNPALCGTVWLFDCKTMEWQHMKLNRNPTCSCCGV